MVITWKHALVGAGLIGLGYLVHESLITEQMRNEIARRVRVPEEVVEKAIEKAVSRSVDDRMDRAMLHAMERVEVNLRNMVQAAVVQKYADMAEPISQQIAIAAAKVDTDLIRRNAVKEAKEAIMEKLDDCMDDILTEIKSKIENADVDEIVSAAMNKSKTHCVLKIV